jgi:ubiquinone/menaquinone biosynthesis C-methylase UbiE
MKSDICSAKLAIFLDNPVRRFFHNPDRILSGLIKTGDTAVDIGCGPGVFTMSMARMVGSTGKVIAVDIQDEMLEMVKKKADAMAMNSRVKLQKCKAESLCVTEQADFILTFYMVHEVPDQERFFRELSAILKKGGTYLLVEPAIFHVSKSAFEKELKMAKENGLRITGERKLFMSRAVLFTK